MILPNYCRYGGSKAGKWDKGQKCETIASITASEQKGNADAGFILYNGADMIDLKQVRERPDELRRMFEQRAWRNPWEGMDLDGFFALESKHRALLGEIEACRTRRNQISEEFAKLKKEKKDTAPLTAEIAKIKEDLPRKEEEFNKLDLSLTDAALRIPNFLHESVPQGKTAEDNRVVREQGEKPKLDFPARQHWEIGESLGILDFAAAGKISGTRFSLLKGMGAALERALISFMLDLHTREHGYTEIFAPYLVTRESMLGTGQLPKFEEELFRVPEDGLYLIPTAEVSVTNIHRGEVLDESSLPKKYVCYSACFRREAGSHGKDTKGLIRNHQFNKVELVQFASPSNSLEQLEKLTSHACAVLEKLNIPYRVVALCSGDTGFASAKTYDLEVWMPGEQRWREISSCSCFTDFQARRMDIKFKNAAGKRELVHTLNGSGVAVGRLFAAVLENHQQKDGSVKVPEPLREYLKADFIRV